MNAEFELVVSIYNDSKVDLRESSYVRTQRIVKEDVLWSIL